jgi:hypothetical protein
MLVDAAGMANVATEAADVNSGYWNPAGLIHLEDHQLSLMHANYFANADYMGMQASDDLQCLGYFS